MSQEQDKKENSCSAGKAFAAGLAVTAIGVGIGSALYYFFGRDDENQQEEPSTSFHAEQNFRKRAYTLEECSVCFDVMLTDQELMALPCSHNFHLKCISPWLERNQTCPVCRHKVD